MLTFSLAILSSPLFVFVSFEMASFRFFPFLIDECDGKCHDSWPESHTNSCIMTYLYTQMESERESDRASWCLLLSCSHCVRWTWNILYLIKSHFMVSQNVNVFQFSTELHLSFSVANVIPCNDSLLIFVQNWLQCVWFLVFYQTYYIYWSVIDEWVIDGREFLQVRVYIVQCIWSHRHRASSGELNGTHWLPMSLPFYCFSSWSRWWCYILPFFQVLCSNFVWCSAYIFRVVIKPLENVRVAPTLLFLLFFTWRIFMILIIWLNFIIFRFRP